MVDDIRWWMTLKPFFGSLHSQWAFLSRAFCFWVHCVPNNRSSCIWLSNPLGSFFLPWAKLFTRLSLPVPDKRQKCKYSQDPPPSLANLGRGGGEGRGGCLICSHSTSGSVLDLFSCSPIGLSSLEVCSFARTWVLPSCSFFSSSFLLALFLLMIGRFSPILLTT